MNDVIIQAGMKCFLIVLVLGFSEIALIAITNAESSLSGGKKIKGRYTETDRGGGGPSFQLTLLEPQFLLYGTPNLE